MSHYDGSESHESSTSEFSSIATNSNIPATAEKIPESYTNIPIISENAKPRDDDAEAEAMHPVVEMIEKQELGKLIMTLAAPMAMGLYIASYTSVARSNEIRVVSVTLSFAVAAVLSGMLLQTTCRTASTLILMAGIAFMMLAFYAFLACIFAVWLKWIPVLCWFLSVSPIFAGFVDFCRKTKKKKVKVAAQEIQDPENGERYKH